eukprot:Skav228025  [mRNA]  locus=scaffold1073:197976:198379:+ [translate_table: standard]
MQLGGQTERLNHFFKLRAVIRSGHAALMHPPRFVSRKGNPDLFGNPHLVLDHTNEYQEYVQCIAERVNPSRLSKHHR